MEEAPPVEEPAQVEEAPAVPLKSQASRYDEVEAQVEEAQIVDQVLEEEQKDEELDHDDDLDELGPKTTQGAHLNEELEDGMK